MLDGLGNLGGLGQITKMLDAGNWVKQAVNSVLPKNMAVVGDAAGALFDLKTGNVFGAAQLAMDGLKDLPQATKSQQQQTKEAAAGAAPGQAMPTNPALEPSPPPSAAKPLDFGKLSELFNQILEMLRGKQNTTSRFAMPEEVKNGLAAKAHALSEAGTSGTRTTTTTTFTSASGLERTNPRTTDGASRGNRTDAGERSSWVGTPATPAPASTPTRTPATTTTTTSSAASSPAPAASTPAAAPAASSAPAAPLNGAPAAGETISSLAQFNSMSDSAVRDAVIHGRISPEIAKDQTAMMAIQQRMNAISEMNNLMTNMMRALHDMQMAVVQNIRI
jgi:hypothetical protein